jgi:hypothetical protein
VIAGAQLWRLGHRLVPVALLPGKVRGRRRRLHLGCRAQRQRERKSGESAERIVAQRDWRRAHLDIGTALTTEPLSRRFPLPGKHANA